MKKQATQRTPLTSEEEEVKKQYLLDIEQRLVTKLRSMLAATQFPERFYDRVLRAMQGIEAEDVAGRLRWNKEFAAAVRRAMREHPDELD